MGVLKDVYDVLQVDLFNMEMLERVGQKNSKKESIIKHIEELKNRMECGEDE